MKRKPINICHLCRRRTDEEHFCHGCRVFVCHDCDKTMCTGEHVPADHLRLTYGEYHGS